MIDPTSSPRKVMVTEPGQLGPALQAMTTRYPDVHDKLVAALQSLMDAHGSIVLTVTSLARKADVRAGRVSAYLRSARLNGSLNLLGRDMESGRMRYCAYQPAQAALVPSPRETLDGLS